MTEQMTFIRVATKLRKAAEAVDRTSVRDGQTDEYSVDSHGMVQVDGDAMNMLRDALISCMGKSAFYADEH